MDKCRQLNYGILMWPPPIQRVTTWWRLYSIKSKRKNKCPSADVKSLSPLTTHTPHAYRIDWCISIDTPKNGWQIRALCASGCASVYVWVCGQWCLTWNRTYHICIVSIGTIGYRLNHKGRRCVGNYLHFVLSHGEWHTNHSLNSDWIVGVATFSEKCVHLMATQLSLTSTCHVGSAINWFVIEIRIRNHLYLFNELNGPAVNKSTCF